MTNLQKLQRLAGFFASCGWDLNNNKVCINALKNGWEVEIEFDYFNTSLLKLDLGYASNNHLGQIQWTGDAGNECILNAFIDDFEGLDALLGEIFTHVVLTDLETISLDTEANS